MSALGLIMSGGATPQVAEPEPVIPMTESDMVGLITIALQEAAVELTAQSILNESQSVLMEGVVADAVPITEKSIIKLDNSAKKQRAYKLAILQCAREDDNKDLKKLETIWKMEKYQFRKLEKRYATQARARMKQASKKTTPKTAAFKRAKDGLTRSQRETKAALSGKTKAPKALRTEYNTISKKLSNKLA